MLKELTQISNELELRDLIKETDTLDRFIIKASNNNDIHNQIIQDKGRK